MSDRSICRRTEPSRPAPVSLFPLSHSRSSALALGAAVCTAVGVALALASCSKSDDAPEDVNAPDEAAYSASGVVTTDSSATIATASGAKIVVPEGAVPPTSSGEPGAMTFSIERDATAQPQLAPQAQRASDIYRFGPEGFVFARPVEVVLPVPEALDPEDVRLFRIDPTSGTPVSFGGVYDAATKTISAQTYEMSSWFAASDDWSDTFYGCVIVDNNSGEWVTVCLDSFVLKFPEVDSNFRGAQSLWCGQYCIDWTSNGPWYLPQGTYWLCVAAGSPATANERHFDVDSLVIDKPWTSAAPQHSNLAIGVIGPPGTLGTTIGPCDCTPPFTHSVGTGDLQVTLTWHSAYTAQAMDLDLWVTDPSGERCFYNNATTASGGRLDRDNRCANYENGRPENIYWDTAPEGEYTIEVDWFVACTGSPTSVPYTVRVVNRGSARTYNGTITPDPRTIEVARVRVGAAKTEFGGPRGVAAAERDYPPKD
jgi:hypothetical protein